MNEQTKNWIWIILVIFVLYKCSSSEDKDNSASSSKYDMPRSSYSDDSSSNGDGGSKEELTGDFDCTATNLTSGNGPYTLNCEHDGTDIIIHFPNGGHITVDEDGFHSDTGDTWEIERE